jgi:WD40 repeat protein
LANLVDQVSVSETGTHLVTVTDNAEVSVWSRKSGEKLVAFKTSLPSIEAVFLFDNRDCSLVLCVTGSGEIRIFDPAHGSEIDLSTTKMSSLSDLRFSKSVTSDGGRFGGLTTDGQIVIQEIYYDMPPMIIEGSNLATSLDFQDNLLVVSDAVGRLAHANLTDFW